MGEFQKSEKALKPTPTCNYYSVNFHLAKRLNYAIQNCGCFNRVRFQANFWGPIKSLDLTHGASNLFLFEIKDYQFLNKVLHLPLLTIPPHQTLSCCQIPSVSPSLIPVCVWLSERDRSSAVLPRNTNNKATKDAEEHKRKIREWQKADIKPVQSPQQGGHDLLSVSQLW